jgi:hypothetical protein
MPFGVGLAATRGPPTAPRHPGPRAELRRAELPGLFSSSHRSAAGCPEKKIARNEVQERAQRLVRMTAELIFSLYALLAFGFELHEIGICELAMRG